MQADDLSGRFSLHGCLWTVLSRCTHLISTLPASTVSLLHGMKPWIAKIADPPLLPASVRKGPQVDHVMPTWLWWLWQLIRRIRCRVHFVDLPEPEGEPSVGAPETDCLLTPRVPTPYYGDVEYNWVLIWGGHSRRHIVQWPWGSPRPPVRVDGARRPGLHFYVLTSHSASESYKGLWFGLNPGLWTALAATFPGGKLPGSGLWLRHFYDRDEALRYWADQWIPGWPGEANLPPLHSCQYLSRAA
jgi:hypothetical protein